MFNRESRHVTGNNILARGSCDLLKKKKKTCIKNLIFQFHYLQRDKIAILKVTNRGPQTPQTDGALMGDTDRYDDAFLQHCSLVIAELFLSAV